MWGTTDLEDLNCTYLIITYKVSVLYRSTVVAIVFLPF